MDLGELGENILGTWASQVGLVANKSGNDKDGWDFIVGFPQIISNNLKSLDLDDSHSQCLIQVKATRSKVGNRSIKLSNLKKLVDSNLPAFYLSIEISEEGLPVKAHIFHVWEDIIERVYKRLRKLDKKDWSSINKKKMRLPLKAAITLDEMHGKALKKALNGFVGTSSKAFVEKKIKIRKDVGYESGKGEVKFEGRIPSDYKNDVGEFYVDFMLGLVDKVELNEFSVFDKRFGHSIEVEKNKGGHVSITTKPNGKAIMKMKSSSFVKRCEVLTDFYLPNGANIKTYDNYFKVLYRAPNLDIIITPNKNKFQFQINLPDSQKIQNLNDFKDVIDFAVFLNEVEFGEKIQVETVHNGDKVTKLEFEKEQVFFDDISSKTIKSFDLANNLAHFFKIRSDIKATPISLFKQYNIMNFVWNILSGKSIDVRTDFWVEEEIVGYNNIILAMPTNIIFGEKIVALQFTVKGMPNRTDEVEPGKVFYSLQSSNVTIDHFEVLNKKISNSIESHEKMSNLIDEMYDNDKTLVIHLDKQSV